MMSLPCLTLISFAAATVWFAVPVFAAGSDRVLFDAGQKGDFAGWTVEDDVVMGGISQGRITRDSAGNLIFSGRVSLDNNGGFSSVQKFFEPIDVSAYRTAVMRLRGDGKDYRFIVESEKNARHYYSAGFSTNGEWQEVEIPLSAMVPFRRGDRLDLPNFPGKSLAQIRLMIANGRAESFRLEISEIRLR